MSIAKIDADIEKRARVHQNSLTKPQGSLGYLEDLACWFAARQRKVMPDQLTPHITVFAGDHGVTDEGVSAFPSVVTGEMVKNFSSGGAAINVLAAQCRASFTIVDVGVLTDMSEVEGVVHVNVRAGTANLLKEAAMSKDECAAAMAVGRNQAREAMATGANLLLAGDMGIGNTTASACIICKLTQESPKQIVGSGTGIDDAGRKLKIDVVSRALLRVQGIANEDVINELGGLEIAAMAGFYLQAAESGVPVIIDGFIATAAALAAKVVEPEVTSWMLASHISHETGHRLALESLGVKPLIDFSMRLGEGSGAALVVPLLNSAIALHSNMATFASAGVTDRDG